MPLELPYRAYVVACSSSTHIYKTGDWSNTGSTDEGAVNSGDLLLQSLQNGGLDIDVNEDGREGYR